MSSPLRLAGSAAAGPPVPSRSPLEAPEPPFTRVLWYPCGRPGPAVYAPWWAPPEAPERVYPLAALIPGGRRDTDPVEPWERLWQWLHEIAADKIWGRPVTLIEAHPVMRYIGISAATVEPGVLWTREQCRQWYRFCKACDKGAEQYREQVQKWRRSCSHV